MFHWVAVDDKGNSIDAGDAAEVGLDGQWETQQAAEAWLGQMWEELLFYEVAEVSLYRDDELVMEPMKLSE
ncbi:MAG: hypothetical protein LBC29_04695 [Propionibacteriaceae bacterium]|jgi:hypothetical protein|nr:hypothetical protein [Propionibacteriaceae bacterium]